MDNIRRMQIDDLIDEMLEPAPAPGTRVPTDPTASPHRERLAALVAGGQAKRYLGRAWTVEQIDTLGEEEVENLYAHYEARLGAAITKTLGQAALQLYSGVASTFLPIPPENRPALTADLEADPFVNHALNSATCELYHRYGMLLAPLTIALTTAKYCQFEHQCPVGIATSDGGEPADGAEGPASYEGDAQQ